MIRTLLFVLVLTTATNARPFVIEVVDDQTGRGVPLVELRTPSNVCYYTDSAGLVAFDEPGLMGEKIWFTVSSFGYEFPADGFGSRGVALEPKPGGEAKLKIKRINIAERLYRITGEGIYRDTVLAGRKPPIKQPLLNAQVAGSDSVCSIVYRDRIHFFWGDTGKMSYSLGNFGTTGAIAKLPGKGGLDPAVGVDLEYFKEKSGFSKPMVPFPKDGAKWVSGFMVLKDDTGRDRLVGHVTVVKSLAERLGQSLIVYNDEKDEFEELKKLDKDEKIVASGHPFEVSLDGKKYFYFALPYPNLRVQADWKSVQDKGSYESFTCMKDGKLELDRDGKPIFAWRKNAPPLGGKEFEDMIKAGRLNRADTPWRLENSATKKPILLHGGSVAWNDYRKKWTMIGLEIMGESLLGEVYYAEASSPEGPWTKAVKVLTHHRDLGGGKSMNMDFYNPRHHPFFDQDGGRIIYFEGTYTHMFGGGPIETPRYEYNQIMHRLDLSDARLHPN